MNTSGFCVVIPVFNEEKTIVPIIQKILDQKSVSHIVVINDGSNDGTSTALHRLMARESRIHLIEFEENRGKGEALHAGFTFARRHSLGTYIIVQDADLEYDPEHYSLFYDMFNKGADIVYGSRFMQTRRFSKNFGIVGNPLNYSMNMLLTFLNNILHGATLTDVCTGYKAFRKELLDTIDLKEKRFGFCMEFTAKALLRGHAIHEVPISYTPRSYKQGKKIRMRDGINALRCVFLYAFFA